MYKILQIDSEADLDIVKAAYRRLAHKYHPDKSTLSDSTHRMAAINEAYKILVNPESRQEYDETLNINQNDDPISPNPQTQKEPASKHAYGNEFSRKANEIYESLELKEDLLSEGIKTKLTIRKLGFFIPFLASFVFLLTTFDSNEKTLDFGSLLMVCFAAGIYLYTVVETARRFMPKQRKLDKELQEINYERVRNNIKPKVDYFWNIIYIWGWIAFLGMLPVIFFAILD